jgi:hypothetical protein
MIKHVKAAKLWCCTKIVKNKDKIIQTQTWHSDLKDAKEEDKNVDK